METKIIIDKNLYPLDCIYTTSYMFLDKAYIFLTQKNENEIIAHIKLKNKEDITKFTDEFKNQLLNYANLISLNKDTIEIKKQLLNEILYHNNATKIIENDNLVQNQEIDQKINDEEINDPEGILIPWEEKHKKNE
ncbi:MAG: hypothetical protein ACLFPJ_05845 [Candidatus Woesearchaeota archaeon]